jgi:hypothetical protein
MLIFNLLTDTIEGLDCGHTDEGEQMISLIRWTQQTTTEMIRTIQSKLEHLNFACILRLP